MSAEKLIEKKGAVETLAAALAHISGAASVKHSLISSQACVVSMIIPSSIEMPNVRYAWKELEEQRDESFEPK